MRDPSFVVRDDNQSCIPSQSAKQSSWIFRSVSGRTKVLFHSEQINCMYILKRIRLVHWSEKFFFRQHAQMSLASMRRTHFHWNSCSWLVLAIKVNLHLSPQTFSEGGCAYILSHWKRKEFCATLCHGFSLKLWGNAAFEVEISATNGASHPSTSDIFTQHSDFQLIKHLICNSSLFTRDNHFGRFFRKYHVANCIAILLQLFVATTTGLRASQHCRDYES